MILKVISNLNNSMDPWSHCNWGWRMLTFVRFVFILLMFFAWTHLKKLQQNAAVRHCTLHRECSCLVATAGSYFYSVNWIALYCSLQVGTDRHLIKMGGVFLPLHLRMHTQSLQALGSGWRTFFPSAQPSALYHHGWHGNPPAVSAAPNCASHLQGQVDCSCGSRTCMKSTSSKATSVKISVGLKRRDEIISPCLFPVEVSSMTPGQQRFHKSIAVNTTALYFDSIVINPRLQTHLDSFQCVKYFTWRIHVGNSSFLEVFHNRLK